MEELEYDVDDVYSEIANVNVNMNVNASNCSFDCGNLCGFAPLRVLLQQTQGVVQVYDSRSAVHLPAKMLLGLALWDRQQVHHHGWTRFLECLVAL